MFSNLSVFSNFTVPAVLGIIMLGIMIWIVLPKMKMRGLVLVLYTVFSAGLLIGTGEVLGLAKPIEIEWRAIEHAPILSVHLVEGKAIYLWVQEGDHVRTYALAWDSKMSTDISDEWAIMDAQGKTMLLDGGAGEAAHVHSDGENLPSKTVPPKPTVIQIPEIRSPSWHPQPGG